MPKFFAFATDFQINTNYFGLFFSCTKQYTSTIYTSNIAVMHYYNDNDLVFKNKYSTHWVSFWTTRTLKKINK